jgi:hypothetical protein
VIDAAAAWLPSSKTLPCLWRVNKAVLQYYRPDVLLKDGQPSSAAADEEWYEFYQFRHALVQSPTEEMFKERLSKFELNYVARYPRAIGYIKAHWLEPYKERIIKA